ncbi:hypothetical protein EYF80_057236 [Liparis tanakae]|uniref:Uncharacterized protein n=1 Tax=Liparis tanakae TaxID=230148 RepID=A0A4Z2EVN3_9TELE|nr:hypothetical protein EYF80_057236 [Liparis tanakae]
MEARLRTQNIRPGPGQDQTRLTAGARTGPVPVSGVQGAVLLKSQSSSRLSIVSRAGDNGPARLGSARLGSARPSSARLGSARLGPARRAAAPPGCSARAQGRGAAAGLRAASSRAAAIPLDVRLGSDPVQTRFTLASGSVPCRRAAAAHLPFHGRRAEAAGRKEGRKNTRGACWEVSFAAGSRAALSVALKTPPPSMHL